MLNISQLRLLSAKNSGAPITPTVTQQKQPTPSISSNFSLNTVTPAATSTRRNTSTSTLFQGSNTPQSFGSLSSFLKGFLSTMFTSSSFSYNKPTTSNKPCKPTIPPPPPPPKEPCPPVVPPPPPPPPEEPCPPVEPPPPPPPPEEPCLPEDYNGGTDGCFWGDPHLVGFDGEKYDVMGKAGNTYNMISDKGFQYNTTFIGMEEFIPGATAIGATGFQVGTSQVSMDRNDAAPKVNGQAMAANQSIALDNGGSALWDGSKLTVNSKEYNVVVKSYTEPQSGIKYLESDVKINGSPFADGVKPHGLLGQTADGVAGHKNTGVDQGLQGGTVIDGTVTDYEVSSLFDNTFQKNNRYNATPTWKVATAATTAPSNATASVSSTAPIVA
jgi:hypothetical protein